MRKLEVVLLVAAIASPFAVDASRVAGVVKLPVLLKRVEPKCRHRRHCSPAVLEAVITKSGSVRDAKISDGARSACTDAAIAALAKWEYRSATLNDQPVDVIWNYRVTGCHISPDPGVRQ